MPQLRTLPLIKMQNILIIIEVAVEMIFLCQSYNHFFLLLLISRTIDTASLEFGAAPEAVNQVQPALRLKVANIVSTPTNGKPVP